MYLYGIEEKRNGLVVSYLRLKPFFREKGKVDAIVSVTDVVVAAPAPGQAVSGGAAASDRAAPERAASER
jgi:hypothetical protein